MTPQRVAVYVAHGLGAPTLLLSRNECETIQTVWQFARILRAAGLLDNEQLDDYMEKPWKWQPEYAIWHVRGCPDLDGDAGAFDAFAEAAHNWSDDTYDDAL